MGYLNFDNSSLSYLELKPFQKKLKKDASIQFLYLLKYHQHKKEQFLKHPNYGYEIEAQVLQDLSSETETRYTIQDDVGYLLKDNPEHHFETVTEFGGWCIEFVPKEPMDNYLAGQLLLDSLIINSKQLLTKFQKQDLVFMPAFNPFINTKEFLRDHYHIPFPSFVQYPKSVSMAKQPKGSNQMITQAESSLRNVPQPQLVQSGSLKNDIETQETQEFRTPKMEKVTSEIQSFSKATFVGPTQNLLVTGSLQQQLNLQNQLNPQSQVTLQNPSSLQNLIVDDQPLNLEMMKQNSAKKSNSSSQAQLDLLECSSLNMRSQGSGSMCNNPSFTGICCQKCIDARIREDQSILEEMNIFSMSSYMTDHMIRDHPRYQYFARNTRMRAQQKPQIRMPLFKDIKTEMKIPLDFEKFPGEAHLDSFCAGMFHHSFQLTYAAKDITQARWLTDQFHMLAPIMMALGAGSPCQKGKLIEWDSRWPILQHGCDDRNERERSQKSRNITQSRYNSIRLFISDDKRNLQCYNDLPYAINKKIKKYTKIQAKKMGVDIDENMLNHWAQLCHKENISAFKTKLEVENDKFTNHFEAIQSSNWNDVRFKPPPAIESKMPWRVEFRSIESLFTAEQMYLFGYCVQIFQRMLISEGLRLNLYIPMSFTQKNMERGWMRAAATEGKFYFRTNVFDDGPAEVAELTIAEILCGSDKFIGFEEILNKFIKIEYQTIVTEALEVNYCTIKAMRACMGYFKEMAKGNIPTNATLIRQFIMDHPLYQQDSILSPDIQHDLVKYLVSIQNGYNQVFNDYTHKYTDFTYISQECLKSHKATLGENFHNKVK